MITDKIDAEFKQALREKNELVVSAIRNLKSELHNTEIEKRKSLSEEEVLQVIKKKVKQHRDSIESFKLGNRMDLVEVETKQMEVLEKYLPTRLDESGVRSIVKQVIAELKATPADFGKVMKESMNRAKGAADGGNVSKIVKEELAPHDT